jgi:hypothetical protein
MSVKVLFVVKEIEGAEPIGTLYIAGCLGRLRSRPDRHGMPVPDNLLE